MSVLIATLMAMSEALQISTPRVGDSVVVDRELLAEVARRGPGPAITWRHVPEGARGKLIGWREQDDEARALVEIEKQVVVLVRERWIRRRS